MLSEIIHPSILRTKWAGYRFRRQFIWICMALTHAFQDGKKMVSQPRQLTTCMSFPPSYKSNLVLWGSGVAAVMRWLVLTVVPRIRQCSSRSLASAGLVGLSHEAQYLGLEPCEPSQLGFKKVVSRKIYEELGSMCIDIYHPLMLFDCVHARSGSKEEHETERSCLGQSRVRVDLVESPVWSSI